jgi:hypothetical protein
VVLTPITHEVKQKKIFFSSVNYSILIYAANSPHFAYKRRVQCSANNIISGLHIASILLALCRTHRFIYYGNMVRKKNTKSNHKKITSSSTVRGPYLSIRTTFFSPWFSLDTAFSSLCGPPNCSGLKQPVIWLPRYRKMVETCRKKAKMSCSESVTKKPVRRRIWPYI